MWSSCFSLGSRRSPPSAAAPPLTLTHCSLARSLTHSLSLSLPHSLCHSLTHSLCHSLTHSLTFCTEPPHFPFAWQAQYTELPGGAATRWPPLARGSARGCLLPGRRSTQSLRTSLLRGRRGTQSFLAELQRGGRRWPAAVPAAAFCLAGAVHRASALPFCVAGAVHRASWRSCNAVAAAGPRQCPRPPFAWQAQYTEPPHFPFAWQAQYTELPGGAAARWPPLARGCLLPGSQPYTDTEPGVAGAIHRAPLLITNPHSSTSDRSTSHHNSSQLITSQLITVPLVTPHFSQLPYHITTSHHTLSQLIPSQLHFSHPFSHLTYIHLPHQNSSQLHFSHLTSQVHFSHLTSHLPEVHIKILHT